MNGPRPGKCRDAWCFCPHGNYWDCLKCGGDAAVEHRCVPFTPKRNAELEALRDDNASLTAKLKAAAGAHPGCGLLDDLAGECQCATREANMRAQVARLAAVRDEARQAHALLDGSLEVCVADWRRDLDTAQAACVAMRKALQAEEDYSQKARPSGNAELLERAVTLRRAALATDAGAPILALLDECAAVLAREQRRPAFPMTPEQRTNQQTDADLLTRLEARGPSRFVSVEKVREVAMKVAETGRRLGVSPPMNGMTRGELDAALTTIVDALLAEVTT